MTTPLVILGAGGFGREVHDVVDAMNQTRETFLVLGFLDDQSPEGAVAHRDASVIGPMEALRDIDATYLIGVGDGAVRRRLDQAAISWGKEAASAIHPSATFGRAVSVGPGCVVTAGVRLTTNIVLGRHVHLNLNSTVGHDARLGDYVTVFPGATISGSVVLEDEVSIGTNAAIIQGLTIGKATVVGAGAAVVKDLPPGVVAVGVPARPIG